MRSSYLPPRVLQVRPSQRKLRVGPGAGAGAGAAAHSRTQADVEVLKVARARGDAAAPPPHGAMNPQIMLLLEGWGVPRAALRARAAAALRALRDAAASPAHARAALDFAPDSEAKAEARGMLEAGLWGEPVRRAERLGVREGEAGAGTLQRGEAASATLDLRGGAQTRRSALYSHAHSSCPPPPHT